MTLSSDKEVANPGSNEAVHLGCKCPVLDNAHGKGIEGLSDTPLFWIDGSCVLHGQTEVESGIE